MKLRLPAIEGVIARRLLINYRVRPDRLMPLLPEGFRPKVVAGWGLAGLCLIRLENARPRHLPAILGLSSENLAHRIAVEWPTETGTREGVFIPQRHTDSRLNTIAGGRLFPGEQRPARFRTWESDNRFKIEVGNTTDHRLVRVQARIANVWSSGSVFPSFDAASEFFRCGSCGWSPDGRDGLDGVELHVAEWKAEPLFVEHLESSFFDDRDRFPADTIAFDSALLMRGIQHEWRVIAPWTKEEEAA